MTSIHSPENQITPSAGVESAVPNLISQPLSIGSVMIAPRLVLAPMSGVTNSAFRRLVRELNPGTLGLVVTEFISIEGLTRSNRQSLQMLRFAPEERKISIQIFGYDIDRMRDAALMAQDVGADIVDINSGCPVPRVVRRGGGCELMRQADHLEKILTTVRKAISVPLTLKIRTGWDEKSRNGIEVAKMAENAGVSMVAMHGRTRVQLYRGESDWEYIARAAEAVKIPIIGSGDVIDLASAKRYFASGVSGLMIGRGAIANPWIFTELACGLTDQPYQAPRPWEIVDVMNRYLELLLQDMPEKGAIGKMKQIASQITRRIPGGVSVPGTASVRRALCRSRSLAEFTEVLGRFRNYLKDGEPLPVEWWAPELEGTGELVSFDESESADNEQVGV